MNRKMILLNAELKGGTTQTLTNPNNDFQISTEYINNYNNFALNSFVGLSDYKSNALYSPLSLYLALSLVVEGASGSSQEEVLKAFNISSKDLTSLNYYLLTQLPFNNDKQQFLLNNSLWLNKDFSLNEQYHKFIKQHYGVETYLEVIDGRPNKKASDWVKEQTHGLLEPEVTLTDPITIINTLYFKDTWEKKFDPALSYEDDFTLNDSSTTKVTYMKQQLKPMFFNQNDSYTKVTLGFHNKYSLMLVLPNNDNIETIIENKHFLNDEHMRGEVILHLPKFTQKSDSMNLIPTLEKLGITSIFDGDTANLTKMSENPNTHPPLYVSEIIQGTYLTIDEEGGEAAAYTQIGVRTMSMIVEEVYEVKFNKPFLYFLMGPQEEIIFIGVMQKPEQ